jgi:hypothetical protein
MSLYCRNCAGEGRIFRSYHGGNDPDVWDAGKCEACDGSGNQVCEARGCNEIAVSLNEDGDAMCEDCLAEYLIANSQFGVGD